jgi:3',5'-cyclic AMP phosphodiesterase CpdA
MIHAGRTRRFSPIASVCTLFFGTCASALASDTPFVIEPYLQLGSAAPTASRLSLALQWAASEGSGIWRVERQTGENDWTASPVGKPRRIALAGVAEHWLFSATLDGLKSGEPFHYRIIRGETTVFESDARALSSSPDTLHAVIFGDCARDTPEQRQIAFQTAQLNPDLVLVTGDIVYNRGRVSEYLHHFFPIYNASQASAAAGAPLLRSTLWIGACGNHDLSNANVAENPDACAYYWLWSMPRNGPSLLHGNSPQFRGPEDYKQAVIDAAGDAFPSATNFSFDTGKVHWTVLDSNTYVNWEDPALVAWLKHDLDNAKDASWRFVAFHHPPFHTSDAHKDDQWMRTLCPTFEAGGVDIVFNGHVHNYQRTKPIMFKPAPAPQYLEPKSAEGVIVRTMIDGELAIDSAYNGTTVTKANGIIYIVTGAGGAPLYTEHQDEHPETWKTFTAKYNSVVHSLTILDIDGRTAKLRQIDKDGAEIDTFRLTK